MMEDLCAKKIVKNDGQENANDWCIAVNALRCARTLNLFKTVFLLLHVLEIGTAEIQWCDVSCQTHLRC